LFTIALGARSGQRKSAPIEPAGQAGPADCPGWDQLFVISTPLACAVDDATSGRRTGIARWIYAKIAGSGRMRATPPRRLV
jgi:hypothetical protein